MLGAYNSLIREVRQAARDKIKALSGRKKKPLPINEAISVPCFELWVLLHFEKSDAPYGKCVEVINRVCSYISGYEKADAAISKQLMAKVNVAIENADWLEGRAETNNFNPFTSIHKVLQHFATVGQ